MLEEFPNLSIKAELDQLECQDIIRCIFNLSDTDLLVLKALSGKKDCTAKQIADEIGKDRTTAHRRLEKLVLCGLCIKRRKSGNSRGFLNVYSGISEEQVYKITQRKFDACYIKIKEVLNQKIKE